MLIQTKINTDMTDYKLNHTHMGKCLETVLNIDRQNWDLFHEDFVEILVEYGYDFFLTEDERKWWDYVEKNGRDSVSITDFIEL